MALVTLITTTCQLQCNMVTDLQNVEQEVKERRNKGAKDKKSEE